MRRKKTLALLLGACVASGACAEDGVAACASGPSAPEALFAQFAEPPHEAKPWTYWFWINSLTDRETITEDLADIAKLGFGGVMLTDSRGYWDDDDHVRNPSATIRWGGREWVDLVAHGIREAAKRNLKVTINIAASGGHLRGDVDVGNDSPKFLKCRRYRPGEAFERPDIPNYRDVAVFAVRTDEPVPPEGWRDAGDGFFTMAGNAGKRQDGPAVKVRKAVEIRELGSAGEGASLGPNWTILRFGVGTVRGHEMDIDVLDRTAVERHLERVFAPLFKCVPNLVGAEKTLAGLYNVSWEGLMPTWSATFESDFRRIAGYDLRPLLPTLAGFAQAEKSRGDLMRDFRHARGVMMCEHLYGAVRDWAHRHGMIAYSESGGPWSSGPWNNRRNPCTFGECDQYAFLGANDFPQGEFWPMQENGRSGDARRANRNGRFITKPIASAAHIYDRQIASIEAFTHMQRHWSVDPAFLKALGDQAFADGINRMVWHTYTTSPKKFGTPGLEYFAGTHINRNVTWHDDFPAMVKYLSRCQCLLQLGTPVTDVAVLVGDRAYTGWGTEKNGRYRNLVSDEMPVRIPKGFSYDAVNDDALARNPQLLSRYSVVYDARNAKARGGTVDTKGLLPDVETASDYTWCHRRIGGTDAYFLAGEGRAELTFRAQAEAVEIWDAVTGRRTAAAAKRLDDGRTRVTIDLPIGGSCFVMFLEKALADREPRKGGVAKGTGDAAVLAGPWEVSFAYPRGISAPPPEPVRLDALVDFTSRGELKHFSGTATYRTTFTLPASFVRRPAFLSLGVVPSGLAHAYVNGRDCGTIWCDPWKADVTAALKPGRNELEIRYTNNWSNRLIGDCGLEEAQRVTRSALRYWTVPRKGWKPTVFSGYAVGDPLQSSGLLGPIKISTAVR